MNEENFNQVTETPEGAGESKTTEIEEVKPDLVLEQPQDPIERGVLEAIEESRANFPQNPTAILETIANMPTVQDESNIDTIDGGGIEKSQSDKQDSTGNEVETIKERICSNLTSILSSMDAERTSELIQEFNQNQGLLKGKEFRVLRSSAEGVIAVNEKGELEEMNINEENARDVLARIKTIDQEMKGESHSLRKEILHRSNGLLNTYEAYTYSLDLPRGGPLDRYLADPENWIPEVREINEQIINEGYLKAKALAERLGDPEPVTYSVRGNIAAGKTTAISNNPMFARALLNGEATGAIAPDEYKASLRETEAVDEKLMVNHRQVHNQSSMISRAITAKLIKKKSSTLIDKMMHERESLDNLKNVAIENGRTIQMIDLDVPLELSCIRVLQRNTNGTDPLVPFDAIADGYKKIRENRNILIKSITENQVFKGYTLLVADESGKTHQVLQKKDGKMSYITGEDELLERAITPVTESEISNIADILLDEAYIEKMVNDSPEKSKTKVRDALERYKGYTMKQALDSHSGLQKQFT